MKLNKQIHLLWIMLMLFAVTTLHAEYIEGTETTDDSGYGLNGAFRVANDRITGMIIAYYRFDPGMCRGYFNYTFEDITMAPDTIRDDYDNIYCGQGLFYCFVVKDTLKNTYAKVRILSHLGGKCYEYRFGKNTVANNRILISDTTGMNIKHKVSNFFYTGIPYFMHTEPEYLAYYSQMLSWDPPLDSIRPEKYIFYQAKSEDIDTSAPINKAQWEPVEEFGFSPAYFNNLERFRYFNMVIVYSNHDTSDFLNGWTMGTEGPIIIKHNRHKSRSSTDGIIIRKRNNGLLVDLSQTDISDVASLYLFNLAGRKVADLTYVDNTAFSNTLQPNLNNGTYILQLILMGGRSIASPFTLAR